MLTEARRVFEPQALAVDLERARHDKECVSVSVGVDADNDPGSAQGCRVEVRQPPKASS